jgi:hypothetical protein
LTDLNGYEIVGAKKYLNLHLNYVGCIAQLIFYYPFLNRSPNNPNNMFNTIEEAINDIKEGKVIIVVDDDLFFETDLTLKLMVQHHLTPKNIIASRVHKITYESDGSIAPYSKWAKNYSLSNGPDVDFFATSGAGTLYKKEFFHDDVLDEETYKTLSLHTDDLWWFVQSKRVGVTIKRMPGYSKLDFITGTQENGLWNNGNQDRNDPNLKALMNKYSLSI